MKKSLTIVVLSMVIIYGNARGKIKLACIGNSITEGYNSYPYPDYLQDLLGDDYEVQNDGVSGTTMLKKGDKPYWTKGKLGKVVSFNPDIVTIKMGTNDTKPENWEPHHDEFEDDYLSMIDTLEGLPVKPKIYIVLPVPAFATTFGIRDSVLKLIIVILQEIANERNLPIIDANTPLKNLGHLFPDGIHPNIVASDTIAHVFFRALTTVTMITRKEGRGNMQSIHSANKSYISGVRLCAGNEVTSLLFDVAGRRAGYPIRTGGGPSLCSGCYLRKLPVSVHEKVE